jgi:hypothetical protein
MYNLVNAKTFLHEVFYSVFGPQPSGGASGTHTGQPPAAGPADSLSLTIAPTVEGMPHDQSR